MLSVVAALGVALVPPVVNYRSCEATLHTYSEDQQDWALVLNHHKTLQQASDGSLKRAHADSDFREGRWAFPICSLSGDFLASAPVAAVAFVLLFFGIHLAWLACRAFNKLMEWLK
jgi:hypothetical protein